MKTGENPYCATLRITIEKRMICNKVQFSPERSLKFDNRATGPLGIDAAHFASA